jgi:hypothetical protein
MRQPAHSLRPRRQQEMSSKYWWYEFSHHRQVIGVIEDQQPIPVLLQPALDGLDRFVLILRILLRQV